MKKSERDFLIGVRRMQEEIKAYGLDPAFETSCLWVLNDAYSFAEEGDFVAARIMIGAVQNDIHQKIGNLH